MNIANNIITVLRAMLLSGMIMMSLATGAVAQDVHYSQYFNVPLSVNPALTGKIDGTFRVGADYRNQWHGLVDGRNTYSTPSFYGDVPLRFKSKDILGVGISIVSDKSSGGRLSALSGMLSTAYHQGLGSKKNHYLSLGIQLGFSQRKLDLANIKLGDQIELQNESVTLGSADYNNLKGSASGFDMNFGVHWSSKFSERVSLNAGYAAFHVTQPGISLYIDEANLPVRHVVTMGADFGLSDHFRLIPFFLYMAEAKAKETFEGLAAGIPFNANAGMYLGAYLRTHDAFVPYLGFDIKGLKLGVSYDVTTSSLEKTGGGIEISLTYTGKYVAVPYVVALLYCPRF